MKTVDDSNPSLDLGLRSEPEDESSSIIQQMRQVKTDVNLNLNKFERLIGQRLEASRREWNEERDLLTERCCRLESEKQALQGVVERQEEQKKQLAIDYERKLRDKDKEVNKLMTLNNLPTIRQILGDTNFMLLIVISCLLIILDLLGLSVLRSIKSLFVLHGHDLCVTLASLDGHALDRIV